jgi:ABC-type multidrug transport system permease subunit
MPDPSKTYTSTKFIDNAAKKWVYLSVDGMVEVLFLALKKCLNNMSRGRRAVILVLAALALITFIAVAMQVLGSMSPALRLTLYALMLGLAIGALVVWTATH